MTALAVVASVAMGLALLFGWLGALLDDGLCFGVSGLFCAVGATCWLLWFALPVYA